MTDIALRGLHRRAPYIAVDQVIRQNGETQNGPALDTPLVPARMVNEYQYCPRIAYLEWVQGEWAESADTVEGRYARPTRWG